MAFECTCRDCGTKYQSGNSASFRCPACRQEAERKRRRIPSLGTRNCEYCGTEFRATRTNHKFCSRECTTKSDRAKGRPNEVLFTRRCRNKDCPERFVPVNPQHWFHEPACAAVIPERLWDVETILREEASLTPGANPLEIAKAAFGQKNTAVRENLRLRSLRDYLTFDSRMFYDEHPEYRMVKVAPPTRDTGKKGEREIIVQLSDWQVGKWENGYGIEETQRRAEALKQHVQSIVQRQRDAGYRVNVIRLSFGGDMIEGCFIYRGQNVTGLDRTSNTHRITRQIQIVARLMANSSRI